MTRYLFLEISENKKHRVPDTCYINNDYANFMEVTSNSTQCKKCKKTMQEV